LNSTSTLPSGGEVDSTAGGSILLSLFGLHSKLGSHTTKIPDADSPPSWQCVATFQPKSEAVRDVKWGPFLVNIFAMTTDSGYLIIYDIRVVARPFLRLAAHAGECTCVDWHPTRM
jgi:WD40 repeat protein